MATQSLYRRYRPRRFSELKGQDHVVRALRTAVAEGREGQAYLFSGPRGTGKTSSARILAKVLNCEHPVDGEPCCECASCLAVERGVSYDVHELDAASNNGVDAMRDLIEKASLGTPGRHKVYILDEVHMLSKAAEAALLKTLEEPPPHVVFVLATTDPQKMSATIISRTQHLQFHLLPADTLADHVRWVAADAGIDVSEAAIEQVLTRGGGSARDTLSALELVASTGDDGITNLPLDEFVEAMIDRDAGRALTMVAHALSLGTDSRRLAEQLIGHLRNGFLALMAPELVQLPSHRLDALADRSRRLGAAGLVRGIEQLGTALTEMRHAPDPRVLLDVATVQLTAESAATDVDGLLVRLERVERRLAEGAPAPAAAAPVRPVEIDPATGRAALGGRARSGTATASSSTVSSSTVSSPAASSPTASSPAASSPGGESSAPPVGTAGSSSDPVPAGGAGPITEEAWENTVRPKLRGMARAVYTSTTFVSGTERSLTLEVPNAVHLAKCEEHRTAVERALGDFAGGAVTIEFVDGSGGGPGGRSSSGSSSVSDATTAGMAVDGAEVVPRTPHEDEDVNDVDLDDLVDAPDHADQLIEQLTEAFPGAELQTPPEEPDGP